VQIFNDQAFIDVAAHLWDKY